MLTLAGWVWLSGVWSESPTLTLLDSQRVLVYAGGATFAWWFAASAPIRPLVAAITGGVTSVAVYALARYGPDGSPISEPIGYSNALGLLAVIGFLLSLGFVADGSRHASRVVAGVACVPLAAIAVLTYSRGAILALAVGLAVAATLARSRLRSNIPVLVAAAAALVAVVVSLPLTASPAPKTTLREELLSVAGHDRGRYWLVAYETAQEHPLLGSGSGTFERMWLRHRELNLGVLDAHNVYLETLAEIGPVGVLILVIALGLPLVAAVRVADRPLIPAITGAYVAFLVHAAVDWDWEVPAVTLPAFLLGGLLTAEAGGTRPVLRRERAAGVAVALVLAVPAFAGLMANSALTAAVLALDRRETDIAAREARKAQRWALWSAEPRRLAAEAAAADDRPEAARAEARAALERDPGNVQLWRLLARVSVEDRSRAYTRIAELDPRGPPPWSG